MTDLFLDFESRSRVNLKKHGNYLYAEHESTSLICMAWALDRGPVDLWLPGLPLPAAFVAAIADPATLLHAWNATFERLMFHHLGLTAPDISRWRCTMAHAMASGFPGSLADAGTAVRAAALKDNRGKALINWWCQPTGKGVFREMSPDIEASLRAADFPNPDAWFVDRKQDGVLKTQAIQEWKTGVFYNYCRQDVATERDIHRRLPAWHPDEIRTWCLDQTINDRGIHVDHEQIIECLQISDHCVEQLDREIALSTGSKVTAASQAARILGWVNEFAGVHLDSVDKLSVEEALKSDIPIEVARVLELRQAAAKTSTRKYEAMLNFSQGKRIRGSHAYFGGHTGRWGGRGVQFQNLPRPEFKRRVCEQFVGMIRGRSSEDAAWWLDEFAGSDSGIPGFGAMKAVSSMLRSAVIPAPGNKLIVSDFSQIEARVLAWLCSNRTLLMAFAASDKDKSAPDVYKVTAAGIFDVPASTVTSDQRFIGKSAVLGLGYGMGAKRFKDSVYETTHGQRELEPEFCERVVKCFREANPEIPKAWYAAEKAAIEAIQSPGKPVFAVRCQFIANENFLKIKLPSGRGSFYPFPRLHDATTPWGSPTKKISYEGMCFFETGGRKWGRTETYGGKLIENIVQAVARDLLVAAMFRLEAAGYLITMSIHDELVVETLDDGLRSADEMERIMGEVPAWAGGCPVACETWEGDRYGK